MNTVVDYIVRVESDAGTYDRILPRSGDEVLVAVAEAAPTNAFFVVIDPSTCRDVSRSALSQSHHSIQVDFMGDLWVGGGDPSDWEDPYDRRVWAPDSDACAGRQPPTPLLLPSSIPGEALEDGAISCSSGEFPYSNQVAPGEPHALGIRVEAVIGSVAGCSTYVPEESLPLSEGVAYVWDVASDGGSLGIAWLDAQCADGASVSLFPTERGYQLDIISITDRCPEDVEPIREVPYAVTLVLPFPITASSVEPHLEYVE